MGYDWDEGVLIVFMMRKVVSLVTLVFRRIPERVFILGLGWLGACGVFRDQ